MVLPRVANVAMFSRNWTDFKHTSLCPEKAFRDGQFIILESNFDI